MSVDQRNKNVTWNTVTNDNCYLEELHYPRASLAVLMDIRDELRLMRDLRDELQRIRAVFECPNMSQVPQILREIRRNTKKPAKKKRTRS